ncbi:MAG: magnesium transporter CorA family protein [Sphingomonadaceae bacterium]|uniref:magnesium transporter CorA family protein n=1 Tax=Thermaurantiacus sp. TaxID=2820283 RepID=UPI00298F0ECA|nr:magnesium transporter CorA family protein [Thermaurantiacus sp.]MCS6987167.1 magnesium transporter CorA family protein [Sphingomonadaceae bacterium]MDW8415799.1 magnesium transporter CorA family protein [Thermaurantiacus sp.]
MLRVFAAGAREGRVVGADDGPEALADAVWIDVADPLAFERPLVQAATGIELPTRADMVEIEASSRVYREGEALYMTALLVVGLDSDDPSSVPVSFILTPHRLVTVRYSDPHPFRSFAATCTRLGVPASPLEVLVGLLDAIVDRTADILERMAAEIDRLSGTVFALRTPSGRRMSTDDLTRILRQIGLVNFVLNKTHDSIQTLTRMTSVLMVPPRTPHAAASEQLREELKSILRDLESLDQNSSYLSSNNAFLLDAALGRISIEQNAIIKIFSVAAVVFLPPTLVASIYGMNFEFMPELGWRLGYPFALVLMVLAAVIPYLWFKRKGWL